MMCDRRTVNREHNRAAWGNNLYVVLNSNCVLFVVVVSGGVCGSYSCGRACDSVCGSSSQLDAEEDVERSPAKGSSFKPPGR